mgnify:CR=1 FL=1
MILKDNPFSNKHRLKIGDKIIDFSTPKIMGVINATPDSFFDGGINNSVQKAIDKAINMVLEGADFLDVGGYSSRPGADDISVQEEINRTVPVVHAIHERFPEVFISIDTFRKQVAERNLKAGATWVNDISAGKLDPEMISWIKENKIPYIAMHMRGTPQSMQSKCEYTNLTSQVITELISAVQELGPNHPLILDPGFGFSKTVDQNYELINNLEDFTKLNYPFLVGFSRKSMIYKVLKSCAAEALNGTTVLNTIGLLKGASVLRVHDVKEAKEAVSLIDKLKSIHR